MFGFDVRLRQCPNAPFLFYNKAQVFIDSLFFQTGLVRSCQISEKCLLWRLFSFFLHPSFLLFLLYFLFLFCFINNIVTGDQSPSSPSSRWPGANYGNRTLGVCVCLTVFLTGHHSVTCTSVGCITHTPILSKHSYWADLQHAECFLRIPFFKGPSYHVYCKWKLVN